MNPDNLKPKSFTPKKIILFLGTILLILAFVIAGFTINNNRRQHTNTDQENKTTVQPLSPHVIIYGVWSNDKSFVKKIDLAKGTESTIAILPSNIKKVTVLSANELLYIDDTNVRDHGSRISIFSLKDNKVTASIPADPDFGIDDYAISPNKRYLATWEVSFAPDSPIMLGARSRVNTVSLSEIAVKNLIYDEVASKEAAVHYPSLVTDNGTVYMDSFIPNDEKSGGRGYAYGMTSSDFTGTTKNVILESGSYGTQPQASPDGQYIAFGGYDGTEGPGNDILQQYGRRRVLLTQNKPEVYDTINNTRKTLTHPIFTNKNRYPVLKWDPLTGNILVTVLSKDLETMGTYLYDLNTQKATKLEEQEQSFIASLNPDNYLVGSMFRNQAGLGNLSRDYSAPYTQFFVLNHASREITNIKLGDNIMQFIAVFPETYFDSVLGSASANNSFNPAIRQITREPEQAPPPGASKNQGLKPMISKIFPIIPDNGSSDAEQPGNKTSTFQSNCSAGKDNLQLCTFEFKPELSVKREEQQSFRYCRYWAADQCTAMGHTEGEAFNACWYKMQFIGDLDGSCFDSPLYLYGASGTQVDVTIHTAVSNDLPKYKGNYRVTLKNNGKLSIHGKEYDSIHYNYTPAFDPKRPTKGIIVASDELSEVLLEWSDKLGLNELETRDLISYGKSVTTSEYIFLSFFDHEISQMILPITFEPKPDAYRNIVFYFKQLTTHPGFTPDLPVFEKIERNGFTAVEISGMVE